MKSRSAVLFYLNGERHEVAGDPCFLTVSDFLRYERGLTGTKVVCAEGDCGACTILVASVHETAKGRWVFKSINSCIYPVFSLDGCQVVTVEGLKKTEELHPVQKSMCDNFGSQCGYCTPGFVCAMTAMVEDSLLRQKPITEKRTKNYLTGNLCRCTGYDPILKAAMSLDLEKIESLQDRFHDPKKMNELKRFAGIPVEIIGQGRKLFLPVNLRQALAIKQKNPEARLVAGATDLGVAVNKGRMAYQIILSLQNISALWKIQKRKNYIEIPSRVHLTAFQKYLEAHLPELNRMLNIFASPQIKNSGTVVGNVVNASPISDTIPFLLVSDAKVLVQSLKKKRLIPINEFFLGYKKLNLKSNEIVTAIHLPSAKGKQFSKLYKVSLRKDLDISAVTLAVRFKLKGHKIEEARLAFGGVGPVVLRLKEIESEWEGCDLSRELFESLSKNVHNLVSPISDVRGSKEYRLKLCQNLLLKLADEAQDEGFL